MKSLVSPTKCQQFLLMGSLLPSFEAAGMGECTHRKVANHQNSSYIRKTWGTMHNQRNDRRRIYLDITANTLVDNNNDNNNNNNKIFI